MIGYNQAALILDMLTADKGIPTSYADTLRKNDAEEWLLAMRNEMSAPEEMNMWSIEKVAEGRKFIKTKCIFDLKKDG